MVKHTLYEDLSSKVGHEGWEETSIIAWVNEQACVIEEL